MSADIDRSDEYMETWGESPDPYTDVPPPADLPNDELLFPPPSAPYEVAKRLNDDWLRDGRYVVSWRGSWMEWRTTHWAEIQDADLRESLYATLSSAQYAFVTPKDEKQIRDWNPSKPKVANVIEALAALTHLRSDTDAPAWLDERQKPVTRQPKYAASEVISCANGLLNLSTRTMADHRPTLFNLISVPCDFDTTDPGQPTEWLKFLNSLWEDDQESIDLLQEWFGYVLSGRLEQQKLLMIQGPRRSGKGTIARILKQLMGSNIAGPTLSSLGTNFGLQSLIGKPLAIISDARLGNSPSHIVVERLLTITGEDTIDIDRKYRDVWTGKLPTRIMIVSNELPKFRDSSGAIATRMLILQLTESFLNREDKTLEQKLLPELGSILSWSLDGLKRLDNNGRFTEPQSARDAVTLMADLASPISAFVREKANLGPDLTVRRDSIYADWRTWAIGNGHQPGATSTFGRDLRSAFPSIGSSQPRDDYGKQVWHYKGIGLKSVLGDD